MKFLYWLGKLGQCVITGNLLRALFLFLSYLKFENTLQEIAIFMMLDKDETCKYKGTWTVGSLREPRTFPGEENHHVSYIEVPKSIVFIFIYSYFFLRGRKLFPSKVLTFQSFRLHPIVIESIISSTNKSEH